MPEYVYALFDFVPENPDEITFNAEDRIEVIEKDDTYGDGWWQVSPLRSAEPSTSMPVLYPALDSCFADTTHEGKACYEHQKECCIVCLATSAHLSPRVPLGHTQPRRLVSFCHLIFSFACVSDDPRDSRDTYILLTRVGRCRVW